MWVQVHLVTSPTLSWPTSFTAIGTLMISEIKKLFLVFATVPVHYNSVGNQMRLCLGWDKLEILERIHCCTSTRNHIIKISSNNAPSEKSLNTWQWTPGSWWTSQLDDLLIKIPCALNSRYGLFEIMHMH